MFKHDVEALMKSCEHALTRMDVFRIFYGLNSQRVKSTYFKRFEFVFVILMIFSYPQWNKFSEYLGDDIYNIIDKVFAKLPIDVIHKNKKPKLNA